MNRNLPAQTLAFIKAIVNPLAAEEAALVPDMEQADSLCLTDYIETSRLVQNSTLGTSGMLIWLRCHDSTFYTDNAGAGESIVYTLGYGFTDANGIMYPDTVSGHFKELVGINGAVIQGNALTITPNAALVSGLRIFAMGLRVLPTVEFVTDTAVNYMVRIIGGQASMQEIGSAVANAQSVETLIRDSSCAETFANNEGCCVRYNPFQNEQQLRTQSLEDAMNPAQSFAYHKMPVIFIRFANAIPSGTSTPVIISARFWIHGILRKPSPIYAQQSRVDVRYPEIRAVLSGCHPEFPLVTKGHTFPQLAAVALSAVRIINDVTGTILSIPNKRRGARRVYGARPVRGRGQRRRANRRKRPPRSQDVRRMAPRGNGPYIVPMGQRRQPMMPRNPTNVRRRR